MLTLRPNAKCGKQLNWKLGYLYGKKTRGTVFTPLVNPTAQSTRLARNRCLPFWRQRCLRRSSHLVIMCHWDLHPWPSDRCRIHLQSCWGKQPKVVANLRFHTWSPADKIISITESPISHVYKVHASQGCACVCSYRPCWCVLATCACTTTSVISAMFWTTTVSFSRNNSCAQRPACIYATRLPFIFQMWVLPMNSVPPSSGEPNILSK